MKRLICALALGLVGTVAGADPAAGIWKTQPGDDGGYGHVQIAPCGAALCGTLVRGFDGSGAERQGGPIGRQMIWDMKPRGDGSYAGGKIWAPDRDQTYNARMQLTGDRLKVSGCVLGICRGQTWSRVR